MKEWWEIPHDVLSKHQAMSEERAIAYYNTFYVGASGQQVLLDIKAMCMSLGTTCEQTEALMALYDRIREAAGGHTPQTEIAMIQAEAAAIQIGVESSDETGVTENLLDVD